MENPKVSTPAIISKVITMADHSIRLYVDTQEISPEMKSAIFQMHEKFGYFFFDEAEINQKSVDTSKLPEIILEKGEKSPSERLRNTLYVWHEQQKLKEPFDIFYRRTMEKYIQQIKEKLV